MSRSQAQMCSSALAVANRMARTLKLNQPPTPSMDVKTRDTRARIWTAIIGLESMCGCVLGIPTTLRASECGDHLLPEVPAPFEGEPVARLAFFRCGVPLFRIWLDVLEKMYNGDLDDEAHGAPSKIASVLELDDRFTAWYKKVPPELKLDSLAIQDGRWRWLSMQSCVLCV